MLFQGGKGLDVGSHRDDGAAPSSQDGIAAGAGSQD